MIRTEDGVETKVWVAPYEPIVEAGDKICGYSKASIDKAVLISSVPDYEGDLVYISLPGGKTAIVKAKQLITAVRKCIFLSEQ